MKVLICAVNREKFPDPVFPIGASYIASAVKKSGFDVSVFDACFLQKPLEDLKTALLEKKPDIIGISIRNIDNTVFPDTENYIYYYKDFVRTCREFSDAKIILGGSGFTVFPELFMNELSPDFGIRGEGEYAFIDLLNKLSRGIEITDRLIYSRMIKDINFDGFPDRDEFDISGYYKYSGSMNIQTKRGCEFKCSYCTYPVIEGYNYRFRKPSAVVDEIEYFNQKKGIRHFFFVDSVFNHPEEYAKKICEEIISRKLRIKWTGFFIPKFQDPDFIDICLRSGLTSVDFGTDTFTERTLRSYDKSFGIEDIFKACDICTQKDIKFNHSLIFGGPGETYESMNETISNIDKTSPTSTIVYIGIRLFPNTPISKQLDNIEFGINPVFYISESVKEGIMEFLKEKLGGRQNWVIPGLGKGTDLEFLKKLRDRGIKGPLWELIPNAK
jgi:radical SAM superfamily enzyme YgiQ (UPF0313 family)